MPHLAIIIVSYNTCDLLRKCLQSVFRSLNKRADDLSADVIVVDNASSDDSAKMVRSEFPQVNLVASENNLGFTKANNFALRQLGFGEEESGVRSQESEVTSQESGVGSHALRPPHSAFRPQHPALRPPDFVLLLNPDTEVVGDALWQMVNCLLSSAQVGVCGAGLRYTDGQFQHGAFHFPTLAQVILDLFPVSALPGGHRLYNNAINGRYAAALWQGTTPFSVDFVLGAAMMVRAETIQQVGLLDEGYFMYCEEMDWCLRIQQAGWRILALPSAQITHHEGQSSKQVPWISFVRLWRSRFRFYNKHAEHYSNASRMMLRGIVRINLAWRKRAALQRFAKGKISGTLLAEELSAYEEVLEIVTRNP